VSKNRELKEAKVLAIKEKFEKAQGIVFSKYQGLTVEEDTELRKQLRDAGIEYRVFKNTLTTLAAKECGFEEATSIIDGPISVSFGYEDATAPARILKNFAGKHKKLELKGGIIDGKVYDAQTIEQIASIPSKDVLIAKLLGSFKAPLSSFVYLLNAIKESKESKEA